MSYKFFFGANLFYLKVYTIVFLSAFYKVDKGGINKTIYLIKPQLDG